MHADLGTHRSLPDPRDIVISFSILPTHLGQHIP